MTFRTWLGTASARLATVFPRSLRATCLLSAVLLALSVTEQATNAQKRGGNKPPPPEPVLPAARYTLTWLDGGAGWEALFPRDINQSGDVAGYAYDPNAQYAPLAAFAHSASTGVSVNLNGLAAAWWDLNAAEPTLATGWRADTAQGINNSGLIVGDASNANANPVSRAFILVNAFGPEPYFLLLPTVGGGNEYGREINNGAEAVGASDLGAVRYKPNATGNWPYYEATLAIPDANIDQLMDINDNGHLVARALSSGGSYRQKSSGETELVAGHEFFAVSSGPVEMVSGRRRAQGGGKNGLAGGAIRMPLFGAATEALVFRETLYARALNNEGDTVFDSGRGFVYYDAINPSTGTLYGVNGDGILPLDKLVVNQDADWLDEGGIRLDGIRNRDATGLGQICGRAQGRERAFLLTPVVP